MSGSRLRLFSAARAPGPAVLAGTFWPQRSHKPGHNSPGPCVLATNRQQTWPLIREHLAPLADTFIAVTGEEDASATVQLHGFKRELERVFYDGAPLPPLGAWREALRLLADVVDRTTAARPDGRVIVFLDELPWLATPRSGLLQALDHVWNTRLVRVPQLSLVLCGSAASWMLDKLEHARGGLHNRITRRIRLEPFTLPEINDYLVSKGLRWQPSQVIELAMALGGVPYYLRHVRRGASAPLVDEFLASSRHSSAPRVATSSSCGRSRAVHAASCGTI